MLLWGTPTRGTTMTDATQALLDDLLNSAEAQLEAARSLDAAGLDAASERRHAAVVAISAGPRPDPERLRSRIAAIQRVDARLIRILNAGDRTFRRVLLKGQQTYDRNGRMTEARP